MVRMSSTTQSAKNLLPNMADATQISGSSGSNGIKKTKGWLHVSNSNQETDYLNSDNRKTFIQLRQALN